MFNGFSSQGSDWPQSVACDGSDSDEDCLSAIAISLTTVTAIESSSFGLICKHKTAGSTCVFCHLTNISLLIPACMHACAVSTSACYQTKSSTFAFLRTADCMKTHIGLTVLKF